MSTVCVNLFLNALDAMPRGGVLAVSLTSGAEGGTCLTVSDTGHGIPAEVLGRLFTPFASGKSTGTGLGLSLSRRIVAEHGGTIVGCNRADGPGACFTIRLPAPDSEGKRQAGASLGETDAYAVGH
jgi:two-component system sensor histidine kinase HydH